VCRFRAILFCGITFVRFSFVYRFGAILFWGIAFVRFCSWISPSCDLQLKICVKNIILVFSCWDDGASFGELAVICLSVYLITSVRLAIYGLNQKSSPSHSIVRLAGLASVILCLLWRPSFFLSEVSVKPLASFSSRVYLIELIVF
jgi:hypothetical protein